MSTPTIEQLQLALSVAVGILMLTEPSDSRGVSSEVVALVTIASGDASDKVMEVLNKANKELNEA